MKFRITHAFILFYFTQCCAFTADEERAALFHQPYVDESGWANEPIPAENDPEIARIVSTFDKPEPWDIHR